MTVDEKVREMVRLILAKRHHVKPEDIKNLEFMMFEVQPDSNLGGRARINVEYDVAGSFEYTFGLHPTSK